MFGGNSESGFVQLRLCSFLGIVDLQVDAGFAGNLSKIRRNSFRAESVQDKAAIAACHQPQRADRRAQTLKDFRHVNSLPAGIHAVHFAPIGLPDFKTSHGHALIDRRVQSNGCYHNGFHRA